jgi:hypothetical protein
MLRILNIVGQKINIIIFYRKIIENRFKKTLEGEGEKRV